MKIHLFCKQLTQHSGNFHFFFRFVRCIFLFPGESNSLLLEFQSVKYKFKEAEDKIGCFMNTIDQLIKTYFIRMRPHPYKYIYSINSYLNERIIYRAKMFTLAHGRLLDLHKCVEVETPYDRTKRDVCFEQKTLLNNNFETLKATLR